MNDKYGVRVPPGFNGSNMEIIESLFDMTTATIEMEKLFYGFTIELKRSELGEWRFSLTPEKSKA